MNQQEEIREGLIEMLTPELANRQRTTWLVHDIMLWLNLKGVVIKVDEISDDLAQAASESPSYFARGRDMALVSTERTFHIFKDFKDMGYVAVEPLVKEE